MQELFSLSGVQLVSHLQTGTLTRLNLNCEVTRYIACKVAEFACLQSQSDRFQFHSSSFSSFLRLFCSFHIKSFCSFSDWMQLRYGNRWFEPSTRGKNKLCCSRVALKTTQIARPLFETWIVILVSFSMRCFKHLSPLVEAPSDFTTPVHKGREFIPKLNYISSQKTSAALYFTV